MGFFWGVLTILWLLNFRHFPNPNIRKWSCDTYHLQDSWMTLPWELSEWAFTSGNRMFLDLSNRGHLGFVLYTCFCSLIFRAVLMKENPALGLLCKLAIWRSVISRWTSLWGPMKSAPLFTWKQIKMALSGFWFFLELWINLSSLGCRDSWKGVLQLQSGWWNYRLCPRPNGNIASCRQSRKNNGVCFPPSISLPCSLSACPLLLLNPRVNFLLLW